MSGFQFVHIQQFSRKSVAGKAGSDGVTRGGRAGVRGVFAEAARESGAALHVDHPRPPVVVAGLDVAGVEALHDARVDAARCEVAGGKPRRVRQDQATLLTVVASYPATVAECEADPEKAAARDAWQDRNVEWLRSQFGADLVGVIRHDDEAHPHLHAYVVPGDPAMRANALHPGWAAKQTAKAEAESSGLDAKAGNAAGDRAYREAMRGLQDGYWEAVGLPSGLARVGPARRRLTRDAWQAEQAAVGATARALDVAGVARAEADAATADRAAAEARAAALATAGAAYVAAARAEAAKAKEAADAAEAERAAAAAEVARLRRIAGGIVSRAKGEAREIVGGARQQSARLQRLGARLGAIWIGFAGVGRRLEQRAAVREAAAEARASAGVVVAKEAALRDVGGDLVSARQAAADAVRRAESAEARVRAARGDLRKAEAETERERQARQAAEREREGFRGRWAEADNARIALESGRRPR